MFIRKVFARTSFSQALERLNNQQQQLLYQRYPLYAHKYTILLPHSQNFNEKKRERKKPKINSTQKKSETLNSN